MIMASVMRGLLLAFLLYSLARSLEALEDGRLAVTNGTSPDQINGELQMFPSLQQCARSQPRYTLRCYEELGADSLGCESELGGVGSLDDVCEVATPISLGANTSIIGKGTLQISHNVSLSCTQPGCEILILLSGSLILEASSAIRGGTLTIQAANVTVGAHASIDATSLAGSPPAQTSGTPQELEGAGGGHGGRGASCDEGKYDKVGTWGGDMYNWEKLSKPWVYGSRGGTTEEDATELGGGGGGRIAVTVADVLQLAGNIEANGGSVGNEGGGGSGGSVMVAAREIKGIRGTISATGGTGRGGGGGGRVAIDYRLMQDVDVHVHGGDSLGCPQNAGAAGTRFDAASKSLFVSNNNKKSKTDTVLLTFPLQPLWGNLFVERSARIGVPLLWSRIQVLGTINMSSGSCLTFGVAEYPTSQSELIADDYVMENATVTVYGALSLRSKSFLMNHSKIGIVADSDDWMVDTSTVEASNIAYIGGGSQIRSNANLGVHGQGRLQLQGCGDSIKAQRLFLSLFYNLTIGYKAILQAPLESHSSIKSEITTIFCERNLCPVEMLKPSEDCNVNTSSPFTLQICRVEDINIWGLVFGSVVHIQRARTVTIRPEGVLSATALGCQGGLGKGKSGNGGAGGGGGHGGRGGDGVLSGSKSVGGQTYGNSELPCELGSGGGNPGLGSLTAGGGIIVLGSLEHPVTALEVYGALAADGESSNAETGSKAEAEVGGSGGGSGGSLLLFLASVSLGNGSLLSTAGGRGGVVGGGGGGGGRVHFHWSTIPTGDEYMPLASGVGRIVTSGGVGSNTGFEGEHGTITAKKCPQGLYGIFCEECPVGTYKNDTGSSKNLCRQCPPEKLPLRAKYIYVRGGASEPSCPYNCTSEKFRMPHCYTMLEDLIHKFGGPYLFPLLAFSVTLTLAFVFSVARMKLVGNDDFSMPASTRHRPQIDNSFPFLESLNEVLETNRVEDSESHIHRMYFMGSNSFGEPWHLPHSPPEQIADYVYEDAFNRFVEDVNSLAAYQWWEGSVHSILTVLAYPFSWSWQQWRRREKLQCLQEFVRSEYDHACLRSCRSRALYEGLKVAATPDLLLGYVDVFLGGDEKRPELPPKLRQRLPMSIIFGGDGSYLFPYSLDSDNLLTSLLAQAVPSTTWYRLVAGVNAQLWTVRQGSLRTTLLPLITWLETHANPCLAEHDVCVDLAWCQATASGYYQLGLVLNEAEKVPQYFQPSDLLTSPRSPGSSSGNHINEGVNRRRQSWHLSPSYSSLGIGRRRIGGATLDAVSVRSLEDRHCNMFPVSCLLRNIRPVGHQEAVGLIVSLFLLVDLTLTLLVLLQFYSVGIEAVLIIVLVLPFALLLPSAAGLNALFSSEARKSTGLARVYALWNVTSIVNTLVALVIGFVHYKLELDPNYNHAQPGHFNMEEGGWWLLPTLLLLTKFLQARMIDMYIANLEIHDGSLYASDPSKFWP